MAGSAGTTAGKDGSHEVPGDAAEHLEGRLQSAAWSTETLTSCNSVRYASVRNGGDSVTVVVVDPLQAPPADVGGDADPPHRLVLVSTAPVTTAAEYRTVTADLLSSIVFTDRRPPSTGDAGGQK